MTHVDGKSISGKTLNDTVLLIRGQRGTTVSLTIVRSAADPLVFDLTRAEIKLQSVRSGCCRRGRVCATGHLREQYSEGHDGRPERVVGTTAPRHRAGPAVEPGRLPALVRRGGQPFIADGVVLHQANGNGERQVYRAEPGGVATDARLAVLVNKGTASASEILAGALRDNGRAILIGEPTFGKGTVQNVHELSDRSGLRVTTAQWLTPNEHPLQGVGLTGLAVAGLSGKYGRE